MMRKFITLFAAFAVVATALAPVSAAARDHRGGYYDGRGDRYHHRNRHRDDDNDALAAGVVGLVLGLAVGSLASQDQRRNDGYYDRAPPPRQDYYRQRYEEPPRIYRDESYYDQEPYEACTERSWDTYNQRYVLTEVPC